MRKLILLFSLLTLSVGLAQAECVFTYTATEKLEIQFNKLGYVTSHNFDENTKTGTVTFNNNVTTIGQKTFQDCRELQSITLPNSVTEIGSGAFQECNSLQSINLSNVTTIGNNAFETCRMLQSVDLSSVITIGGSAFLGCAWLQSVDLSSVITIGGSAFLDCAWLLSITLPNSVTEIGSGAFQGCSSLRSITLPASVTTIGEKAFYDCFYLTDVTVAWTEAAKIPAINANVLGMIANSQGPSGATLHVPDGTKALYEAKDVWNTFGTIIVFAEYKDAAIDEIEQLATDAKTAIDAASSYKAADAIKLDYKAKINLVIAATTDAINNEASTKAMVDELRDEAILHINGRKEEALTAIAKINEFEDAKVQAIADITNARQGIQNENLNNWIDGAIKDIQKGGSDATPEIDEIKNQILTVINFFKDGKAEGKAEGIEEGYADGYAEGKADGKEEAFGTLGTKQNGPAVIVTDQDDKQIILYSPKKVQYIKVSDK